MGVNNRQRRATKAKARASRRTTQQPANTAADVADFDVHDMLSGAQTG